MGHYEEVEKACFIIKCFAHQVQMWNEKSTNVSDTGKVAGRLDCVTVALYHIRPIKHTVLNKRTPPIFHG